MIAQLQPRDQSEEVQRTPPPGPRAHPHSKVTKRRHGTAKGTAGFAGWMKWVAPSVGLIATIAATFGAVKQLIPAHQPISDPRIEVDERATLTRSSKNKQLELRVNLTLVNEGGKAALIPRPRVSLYVDSPEQVLDIPADDLHFKFIDGLSEVIFPLSLREGAATQQIVCSIGRSGDWYQPGVLHLNLLFRMDGRQVLNRCRAFTFPVPESIQELPPDGSKCITIKDCADFEEGKTS